MDAIVIDPAPLLTQMEGHDAFGQVVDAAPALAPAHHDLANVEQPLDADLGLGPVPPVPALLRSTQIAGGQGAFRAQSLDDPRERLRRHTVPALAATRVVTASEGEPRPLRHRQDARGVRPVLERRVTAPVRRLDRLAADRPQAGVGDELMRTC